jgi:hypothetical protein
LRTVKLQALSSWRGFSQTFREASPIGSQDSERSEP